MTNFLHSAASLLGKSFLDFAFPRSCPMCGVIIHDEENPVCEPCTTSLMESGTEMFGYRRRLTSVDTVTVLLPYSEPCRAVIHALKYHGNPAVGEWLGWFMGMRTMMIPGLRDDAVLAPVPLHPKRERERGYNQSELIAHGFSDATGNRMETGLLARTRATATQTKLDEDERRENVRDVFRYAADKPLGGCPVIIVDDVLTTGSTVSECARVLKENGAGHIMVCVAATPDIGED